MNFLKRIFVISLCFWFVYTKAQTFEWATSDTVSSGSWIVRDLANNLYTAGYVQWNKSFVAKYNSSGNLEWKQNQNAHVFIKGIAADTNGNLYASGIFTDTVSFGNYTLSANGSANMFLLKLNTYGQVQWVSRSYSNAASGTDAITVDKKGNILIIGRFFDSLHLDSFVFDAPMTNQIFLAKYSPSGVCLWAKHLKSETFNGGSVGPKIKSDGLGNSYICGHFSGYVLFDSLQIFAHGGQYDQDIFLSKIDPNGIFLWLKALGGNNEEIIYGPMDVDSIGNTYISSYFSSAPAYFDSYTLTTNSYNYFTAKYDVYGNCKWAKYGATGGICAVSDGYYTSYPSFIGKYDTLGSLQWTKTVSGASNNAMVSNDTDVYLTGSYNGSVNFDTCALSSTSNQMYIAKLSNPDPPIITNIEKTENTTVFSVYPNPTGNIITVSIQSANPQDVFPLKVTNALSQIVYSETIKEITGSFTKQIDLSSLPKGIYFVELQSASSHLSQKKAEVKKIVLQ